MLTGYIDKTILHAKEKGTLIPYTVSDKATMLQTAAKNSTARTSEDKGKTKIKRKDRKKKYFELNTVKFGLKTLHRSKSSE